MTIPVAPVSIHPQFAETQQPQAPGLEVLLTALQHRQELNIQRQKLAQDQQAFELHKKLVGSQLAGSDLDNAKKQADLRDREHDLVAQDQALRLFTGSLPHIDDSKTMGEVMAGIKDSDVARHFNDYVKEHWTNEGLRRSATQQHYDIQKTVGANGQEGLTGVNTANPRDTVQTGLTPASSAVRLTSQQQIKLGEQAEFGSAALAAWKRIEDIRQASPGVEVEVGRVFMSPTFAKAIPGFHNAQDAVREMQKSGASQAAQNYIRAKWSFLDNVVRTRYQGARGITGVLLGQLYQEFMPSIDVLSNGQMRMNELQAITTAQGNSGYDEHPEIWNTRAKRHGVGNIDIQSLLNGGSGNTQLDSIHSRYPAQP